MRVETLNYNLERLRVFLGASTEYWPALSENSIESGGHPQWLLDTFGRMLDYYGCAKSGLSRILLPSLDFHDFKYWADQVRLFQIWGTHKEGYIGFSYKGYQWDIIEVKTINP